MTATGASEGRRGVDLRRLPLRYLVVAALVPVLLLALFGAVLVSRFPAASPATVGSVAPDFAVTDLDGNPIRLADLRGRPVVVNFWASWCGPCVEEFPLLEDAARRHRADDLAIVGIVYQDRSEAARTFMSRNGASWPAAMDPGERVAGAYGILAPPETFFIGRDGTIVARQIGQLSEASLSEQLAAISDEE
ncbi:MAG TPA: TlpA disulfide reductase family protein [Candidatus Limnocylindria bacterium]|nr:TlpA disulfide reductase family protein [Candidatus Limnocylindria bacterium]